MGIVVYFGHSSFDEQSKKANLPSKSPRNTKVSQNSSRKKSAPNKNLAQGTASGRKLLISDIKYADEYAESTCSNGKRFPLMGEKAIVHPWVGPQ
jgi:hypothetical protein